MEKCLWSFWEGWWEDHLHWVGVFLVLIICCAYISLFINRYLTLT